MLTLTVWGIWKVVHRHFAYSVCWIQRLILRISWWYFYPDLMSKIWIYLLSKVRVSRFDWDKLDRNNLRIFDMKFFDVNVYDLRNLKILLLYRYSTYSIRWLWELISNISRYNLCNLCSISIDLGFVVNHIFNNIILEAQWDWVVEIHIVNWDLIKPLIWEN